MENQTYENTILQWRQEMETSLRAENSWLALAGLYWLREGENSVGSGTSNEIALPAGSAPERVGSFQLLKGEITLRVTCTEQVSVDGTPATHSILQPDTTGSPSVVTLGHLTMVSVRRGERFGVRLWDNSRPERQSFHGRIWYPVSPAYCIRARVITHEPPLPLSITNILGDTEESEGVGRLQFQLQGRECSLEALDAGSSRLFIIFTDLTNGLETYPAGRFLTTDEPRGGEVTLDFNKSYNPPCAFTEFATCPLPPSQNRLEARVEAGERFLGQAGR